MTIRLAILVLLCTVVAFAIWSEGWDGPGQGSAILTYSYDSSVSAPLYGEAEHRNAHLAAAMTWAPYAELEFSPGSPELHRDIMFELRDFEPNDQGLQTVYGAAHGPAIFPSNGEPASGQVIANRLAPWAGRGGLPYFRRTVLHEFGHAIGLDHSTAEAVMNTWSTADRPTADDIAQLRSIYAARFAAPAPITEPGAPAVQFAAFPASVTPGFAVTLTWSAPGATSVAINELHSLPASGTLYVYPAASTVYTIVVSNTAASASRSAMITVAPPPCQGRNCTTEPPPPPPPPPGDGRSGRGS